MPIETVKTENKLHCIKYCALLEKPRYGRELSNAVGVYHLLRAFLTFLLTLPFVVHLRPFRFPVLAFGLAMIQTHAFCG
jgi:hypothetical protein